MTRHSILKKVLLLGLCLSLILCTAEKEKKPSNVILITLDTHRADHVSAYDPHKAKTPHIDFFARNGILFENCYSVIPITAPAHASLFYSLPPHLLHLYNNGQVFHPDKKMISLAELFQKRGFRTAAFVSLGVLQSRFALDRGFDLYEDEMPPHRWYLDAQEINRKVIPWLEKTKDHKFFTWIHYSDPHDPYASPTLPPDLQIELNGEVVYRLCLRRYEKLNLKFKLAEGANIIRFSVLDPFPGSADQYRAALNEIEFSHPDSVELSFANIHFVQRDEKRSALIKNKGRILIDSPEQDAELAIRARGNLNMSPSEKREAYRQEVEYLDQQIGELKARLVEWGLLDNCLIVLVGDHGEGLGENKTGFGESYFGHIHFLNSVYTRVPLIIYDPNGGNEGERFGGMATIMDVAPTILGRLGWKKKARYAGRDLLKSAMAPASIMEETYTPEAIFDRFGMLEYPWHMIYTPAMQKFELFQMTSDPQEKDDVYKTHNDDEIIRKIRDKLKQKASEILKRKTEVIIDDKSLEILKSLGYIK